MRYTIHILWAPSCVHTHHYCFDAISNYYILCLSSRRVLFSCEQSTTLSALSRGLALGIYRVGSLRKLPSPTGYYVRRAGNESTLSLLPSNKPSCDRQSYCKSPQFHLHQPHLAERVHRKAREVERRWVRGHVEAVHRPPFPPLLHHRSEVLRHQRPHDGSQQQLFCPCFDGNGGNKQAINSSR